MDGRQRMMIGVVAGEGRHMPALAYQAFGLAEAEQIDVEALAGLEV